MARKYLTFLIESELYGIPILEVKEIIGMMDITFIPNMPEHIKGVINLRGNIITALDLRLKFGFEERSYDDRTCIIVVEINIDEKQQLYGLIVDTVCEVIDLDDSNIEKAPSTEGELNNFLAGIGKLKDKVIMLLEPKDILCQKTTII